VAVVDVREIWEGRRGKADDKTDREYVRTFRVVTNSNLDGPLTIRMTSGVPKVWDMYADANGAIDTGSFCREVEVRQDNRAPFVWLVECRYSSRVEPPKDEDNPLLKPAEIEWDTTKFTYATDADAEGNAMTTSSGETFDPGYEHEDFRLSLKITRNQLIFDPIAIIIYEGAVNSDPWFGFEIGEVLCKKVRGVSQNEKGFVFWKASYEFDIKTEGLESWTWRPLDQGFFELNNAGKQVLMRDHLTFQPLPKPALLNGAGKRLAVGGKPFFHKFYVKDGAPFALLNLP
jgi:hypothetical protein